VGISTEAFVFTRHASVGLMTSIVSKTRLLLAEICAKSSSGEFLSMFNKKKKDRMVFVDQ